MAQTATQRRLSKLAGAINTKARQLGARGRVTAEDLALIFLESEGQCAYCQIETTPQGVSFDHVVPFARGGDNTRGNLVACCITCQRMKFTKTPEQLEAYRKLVVRCGVCGKEFKPRWADWIRGYGKTCSRVCAGKKGGETERT